MARRATAALLFPAAASLCRDPDSGLRSEQAGEKKKTCARRESLPTKHPLPQLRAVCIKMRAWCASAVGAVALSLALVALALEAPGSLLPVAAHGAKDYLAEGGTDGQFRTSGSAPCVEREASCPLPSCFNASHFDAIVVCGGGQTPSGPPPHVVLRLEKAVEMFFAQSPRPFIVTTGRGTWHKNNPRDDRGYDIHEASM